MDDVMDLISKRTLLEINKIMRKLKINFPSMSIPNEKIGDDFEKEKLIEWVSQLKDLDLDITARALNMVIKYGNQDQIKLLIKQPLVALRKMTRELQLEIDREKTPKLSPEKKGVVPPDKIDEFLEKIEFKVNGNWVFDKEDV